jgi:hypothetical protein
MATKEWTPKVGACYVYVHTEHFIDMSSARLHTPGTFTAYGAVCLKPRHEKEEWQNWHFTIGRGYKTVEAAMQAANQYFGKELKYIDASRTLTRKDGSTIKEIDFKAYPTGVLGLLTKKHKDFYKELRRKNEAWAKRRNKKPLQPVS